MKTETPLTLMTLMAVVLMAGNTTALADGNWKKGRIYYRMVCTACHAEISQSIPPASRTMEQWRTYMDADRHDASERSNPKVSYYTSREYRERAQDTNRAAKKFLKFDETALFTDVKAFVVHGAADSDTPASCK